MAEILQALGIGSFGVALLALACFLGKELLAMLQSTRLKAQQDVIASMLSELDTQLAEFYMPLATRFRVSKRLNDTTRSWRTEAGYNNERLGIDADDPLTLRNIVVRRVFMPLNNDLEKLLLEKGYLASPDDRTSYARILEHLILWRSLEDALSSKEMRNYVAHSELMFPVDEVESCVRHCDKLLRERAQLRRDLLEMRTALERLKRRTEKRDWGQPCI